MKTPTSLRQPGRALVARGEFQWQRLASLALALTLTAVAGIAALRDANAQEPTQRTLDTGTGIPLSSEAPDRYTVKQGDTLWDIANVFLRDPWYWPEIWYVNPQIKNPHLIYPGDVLALVSIEGRPQVSIAERGPEGAAADALTPEEPDTGSGTPRSGQRLSPAIRSTPITAAITAIPYEAVAAFLKKPSLMTKDQVKSAPYIVALRDQHVIGGEDIEFYARRIGSADTGERFNVVHIEDELVDPENNKVLGYRGAYAGQGTVMTKGDPAKLSADTSQREMLRGDKLFSEDVALALDFIPHPAPESVNGSIMAVDGVTIAGKFTVVAINRGTAAGLEAGHVLAISVKGETVRDVYSQGSTGVSSSAFKRGRNVRLPDERVGLLMLFQTHERMSYGLIMEATHPVRVGDKVGAP